MEEKKLLYKTYLLYFGLFLLLLVMMCAFMSQALFCDEADVFLGGQTVANGGMIYDRFISQHNPGSYYIAALFCLLGANNYFSLRFFSYIFISLLWTIVYATYKDLFKKNTFLYFPILAVLSMSSIDLGSSVISEQFFAIGAVILFLQFYKYYKTQKISISDALRISFAVLMTFGTTFVAAFTVGWVALSFFVFQIYLIIKNRFAKNVLLSTLSTSAIVVSVIFLPFFIWSLWYYFTGNLGKAIYAMYTFNREIYSSYLGGFGTSVTNAVFSTIDGFAQSFIGGFNSLFHDNFARGFFVLVRDFSVVYVVLKSFLQKRYGFSLFIIGFVLSMSTRGFDNFHSIQTVILTCMFVVYAWGDLLSYLCNNPTSVLFKKIVIIISTFSFVVLALPFLSGTSGILSVKNVITPSISSSAKIVNAITDPDDKVHICTLDLEPVLNSGRSIDISGASTTPWTYDGFGKRELETLNDNNPKIIIVDFNQDVWGYVYSDYAVEVMNFTKSKYTNLEANIWVRNDYYEEAVKRCASADIQ